MVKMHIMHVRHPEKYVLNNFKELGSRAFQEQTEFPVLTLNSRVPVDTLAKLLFGINGIS